MVTSSESQFHHLSNATTMPLSEGNPRTKYLWGLPALDSTHIRDPANVYYVQTSLFRPHLCQCPPAASIPKHLQKWAAHNFWKGLFWSWKASLTCVSRPHQVWRRQEEKTQAFPGKGQCGSGDGVCPKENLRSLQDTTPSRTGMGGRGGTAGSLFSLSPNCLHPKGELSSPPDQTS